jgi:hypothetical protein
MLVTFAPTHQNEGNHYPKGHISDMGISYIVSQKHIQLDDA